VNLENLEHLFIHELKDLYSAENQLAEALPKMAKAASTPELKQGFEQHLKETQVHIQRIEQIFEDYDYSPGGVKCDGMAGLISEGEEAVEEDAPGPVKDAMLIAAAQRVEHYEIAGYGTARTFAKHLGNNKAHQLLQQTLEEEGATDQKLTRLAESGAHINQMALKA
jgi:ferritin-like metal-binding protein YciE